MSRELHIQFTKRVDGVVILRCTRSDGSVTWQRHDKHAGFFSFHDLDHFAVETTLDLYGFYGLIADGWDIEDTTGKGRRGKLPPGAGLAEYVVGLLETERSGGAKALAAVEFNSQIEAMMGLDPARSKFTELQLAAVRTRMEELSREWARVPAGASLDLKYTAG